MDQQELPLEKIDSVIELYSNGQIQEALETIEALSKDFPNNPLLLNISGVCYAGLSLMDDAVKSYEKAIAIKPDYADAHFNLGNILRDLGELDGAIKSFVKTIEIMPEYDEAQYNLGVTLQELGQLDEAIEQYEKALSINPENADLILNLGFIYQGLGQIDEAIEQYHNALTIDPDNAKVLNNLGNAHNDLGQLDVAIKCYEKALAIKPDYADVYYNLGFIYQDLGQVDLAIKQYEHAVDINDYAEAYHSLSYLKKYTLNDPQISRMESLLSSDNLSQSERIQLCLALARVNEGLGKQDEFFKYLDKGNSLRKKELNYSIDQSSEVHSTIKRLFNSPPPSIIESKSFNPSELCPIFIVGMPRSGTSLVEQIISSHQEVYGAGELDTITKLASPIIKNFLAGDINHLTEQALLFIREEYLDMLSQFNTSENIITDKLPLNFQYIGFIFSAFPDAKIVHLKRDARATCWSNYKYYFKNKENGYSYNFDDLSRFYGLYIDLMDFWHELYPNQIYDMCYEDLTINQEEETRKLLEYCELDWDENCLNFHTNKRAVKTISTLQVRQKMYQGSSKAWKKYEVHLKPLIKNLSSF
ncbi:MAG TPA: sulfotransferase family protein [Candidatus Marinimicrobia bacterium]|nr:sulfotransferase family protein [Candidatus Neomarinimicrobiota bacterium]